MRHLTRSLLFVLPLFFLGACGWWDGGGSDDPSVVFENGTLRAPGEVLVLTVPDGVAGSSELFEYVYWATLSEPACQDPTDHTVDFVLAQACLEFRGLYIKPELLPPDLSGIDDVAEYVEAIKQAAADKRSRDFSVYYPPGDFQNEEAPVLEGDRAYIGIVFQPQEEWQDGYPTVKEIKPYSRAWWDGLEDGDLIIEVQDPETGDKTSTKGISLDRLLEILPKTEEERIILRVQKPNGAIEEIETAAENHIDFPINYEGYIFGYLGVRAFTEKTAEYVYQDIGDLESEQELDGVVVDLRANGGGALEGGLALADFLVHGEGPILIVQDVYGNSETFVLETQFSTNLKDIPFVVLVDEDTASSSEIVAACVQHYAAGTLIGDPSTYGKGQAQSVVILADSSAVVIPSFWLLGPGGESWDGNGLTPDIVIQSGEDALDLGKKELVSLIERARTPRIRPPVPHFSILAGSPIGLGRR